VDHRFKNLKKIELKPKLKKKKKKSLPAKMETKTKISPKTFLYSSTNIHFRRIIFIKKL